MSRMAEQQLYIDGGYTAATSGRTFETINPASGEILATVQAAGREDVDRAVKSAQRGQKIWAAMTAMERSRILRRAVEILRERNDELARLETLDTGKPFSEYRHRRRRTGILRRVDSRAGREPTPAARDRVRLHPPRAAGRCRRDWRMELPDSNRAVEIRTGAGGG